MTPGRSTVPRNGTIPWTDAKNARFDIFTVGLLFYELLAGEHPFIRSSESETMSPITSEHRYQSAGEAWFGTWLGERGTSRMSSRHPTARLKAGQSGRISSAREVSVVPRLDRRKQRL